MGLGPNNPVLIRLKGASLYLPFRGARPRPSAKKSTVGGTVGADHIVALSNVSLTIKKGERVAIVGHNGAGKSSLLRVLSGIYPVSSGECEINARVTPLLSSTIGLSHRETGRQNIELACAMFQVPAADVDRVIDEVAEFSELGEFLDLPVGTYSAGMRVRLGFSIVTTTKPDVLVVDEVLSTGDRAFSLKAQGRIKSIVEQANAVVISAHSLSFLKLVCQRAIWLDHGTVKMDGPLDDVWAAYTESKAAIKVVKA
jgi:ABC-type polysaccharide/polyol phosphate transport system ATPase subunit